MLKESEITLDLFRKISDNAPREIFAVEYKTGIMYYSNKAYKNKYKHYDGEKVSNHWSEEITAEFARNNDLAYEMNGEIINVMESVSPTEKRPFSKFFAVMNGIEIIIGMSEQ